MGDRGIRRIAGLKNGGPRRDAPIRPRVPLQLAQEGHTDSQKRIPDGLIDFR